MAPSHSLGISFLAMRRNMFAHHGAATGEAPEPIAIVGMACHLPGASDLVQYWANILRRHDAIEEVPSDRWPSSLFFNTDPKVPDRTVSKWGGFMGPIRLDALTYGIPPASLSAIEPVQLILLEVTRKALADAGYDRRPFARENTAVILGCPGGTFDLGQAYITRCLTELELNRMPGLDPAVRQQVMDHIRRTLPELTEDSFPGILGNVAAGRLANRFDLGGPNFTVDAACACSLAALQTGIQELRHGTSDVALVGAAEAGADPLRISLVQQDRGAFAAWALPPLRRLRRWNCNQRRGRDARSEAPIRRRARW